MLRIDIVKRTAPLSAAALLLAFGAAVQPADAAYISNGDFETLDTGSPPFAAWNETVGVTDNTSDPIGGNHSAQVAGGQAQQAINDPTSDLTLWSIDFDLALSDGGGSGDRSFQLYLQQDSASRINLRITDMDDDGDGDLWAYDQSATAWQPLISDALDFSAADSTLIVNHVRIVGDYASASPSYDIYVTDSSSTVRSSLDNAYYQFAGPVSGTTLEDIIYQGGSLAPNAWFVVDNTVVAAVPEPASLALFAAGGLLMLRRRHR